MKQGLKRKLYLILFIGIITFSVYFGFKVSNDMVLQELINERESYCAELSFQLGDLGKNCMCYFEGFKTGNPEVDDISSPLCACDCIINGTPMKIGLINPDDA